MKVNYKLEGSLKSATRWLPAALLVAGLALLCWPQLAAWYHGSGTKPSASNTQPIQVSPSSRSPDAQRSETAIQAGKLPIESLRVGDRVLAVNPEVTPEERAAFVEPNWHEWLQLSLSMPKGDGSLLTIELLRPESWVRSQMGVVATPHEAVAVTELASRAESSNGEPTSALPYSPIRPIYRELAEIDAELELSGEQVQALFVDMDLPELAITGAAVVHDIRNAPLIATGAGRVVTATFKHSSGDVIDLVISDGVSITTPTSPESIGTTSNHPFWSVDRQEYVQAGQLDIGEQVQTYSGDTKRVLAKLPRPGPEAVYNLEVFAEHVYYVGEDGVLVHNNRVYVVIDDRSGDVVYVGKGTEGRVNTAVARVSKSTGIPQSKLSVHSAVVGDEFKMRGMEQRTIQYILNKQGGSLTKRGDQFVSRQGNLVNRQLSYDPARLSGDKRYSRYIRANQFEMNRTDTKLWQKTKRALGI